MALFKSKTCSLCGGKLDGNRRCLECGLDNSKNDDMYKKMLKQSQCENRPLTHVHHEESMHSYDNTYSPKRNKTSDGTKQSNRTNGKKNSGCIKPILTLIIVICGVIPAIVSLLNVGIINFKDDFSQEQYEYSEYLDGGFYTVGVHIPEGEYDIELISGDFASIDIFEYQGSELLLKDFYFLETGFSNRWAKDVYLEAGEIFVIEEDIEVALRTDDDSRTIYDDNIIDNPLDILDINEEMNFVQGTMIAGEDFPAGVYDIYYSASYDEEGMDEYGSVDIVLWNGDMGELMMERSLYFNTSMGDMTYKNVPFTKASQITVKDLHNVYLIPSEFVDANTTYLYEY